MASSNTLGSPSPRRAASTTADASRYNPASASRSTNPVKRTSAFSAAARASSEARSGPLPAITSGRPAAAQASITTSIPLSGMRRPTLNTGPSAGYGDGAGRSRPFSTTANLPRTPGTRSGETRSSSDNRSARPVSLCTSTPAARAHTPGEIQR